MSKRMLDKGLFQLQYATVSVLELFKNTWNVHPSSWRLTDAVLAKQVKETQRR